MRVFRLLAVSLALLALIGCLDPSEGRPGLRLTGEVAPLPGDWSFTDAQQEIAIEVHGILGVPHSVTIWCATLDGALFIGSRDPQTKHWTAWADANPNVRLKIAGKIYEVRLTPLDDAATIARLQDAYGKKYALPAPAPNGSPPPLRYWSVGPR
jgi:hypothetical protein